MSDRIIARPTPWKTVILLCGKCARKMSGGYGPKGEDKLRTVLREAFRNSGRRRDVRIVETRCMGICPTKAVTAMNATHPDRLLTIPKGTSADQAMAKLVNEAEQ